MRVVWLRAEKKSKKPIRNIGVLLIGFFLDLVAGIILILLDRII